MDDICRIDRLGDCENGLSFCLNIPIKFRVRVRFTLVEIVPGSKVENSQKKLKETAKSNRIESSQMLGFKFMACKNVLLSI